MTLSQPCKAPHQMPNDRPPTPTSPIAASGDRGPGRRILITAGPTHEPIDAVRFIGNRSSGRVGISLAEEAAARGWTTTLLLGPVSRSPADSRVRVERFRTCEDLRGLLRAAAPACDVLVMAAAVADFRPKPNPAMSGGKFRRSSAALTLELEPTPDLLAETSGRRRPGQMFIGFALEPRDELEASARSKLARKGVDMVVGNPLETMDGESIEAMVLHASGRVDRTDGAIPKPVFARWLMDLIERHLDAAEGRR